MRIYIGRTVPRKVFERRNYALRAHPLGKRAGEVCNPPGIIAERARADYGIFFKERQIQYRRIVDVHARTAQIKGELLACPTAEIRIGRRGECHH